MLPSIVSPRGVLMKAICVIAVNWTKLFQLLKQRVIKVLTFDHHAAVEIKEPLCIGSWLCSQYCAPLASLLASWASSFEVGGLGNCCKARQGSLETCVQEGSVCKCLGACNHLTYEPSSTKSFASLSSDTGSPTLHCHSDCFLLWDPDLEHRS